MRRRVFDNKAKRAWWQVHVDAWQKSGLTATAYCRQHRLTTENFRTWRRELDEWEAQKAVAKVKRRGCYHKLSHDNRSKAVQAFWAMHVEAWQWSGLSMRDYCMTHRLSTYSLKRWRNMIEAETIFIDWRTMLHASALPLISTKISTRTKEREEAARLTARIESEAPPPKRATRRRFSLEEKLAILLEIERHGETVSSIGRIHGISTSVLFRWRDQLGYGHEKSAVLVPVRVVENRSGKRGAASMLTDLLPCPDGMAAVLLPDGRSVFAPLGADPEAVRREVAAREMQS